MIVQAYDLIMLIVLAMATIFGAIKGFAWQVASIASVIVSYIVAYRFRMDVAEMIHAKPPWNQFLAMLILYVGTSFVIWVGFRLLSGAIDRVRLKEFDRHLGAAFGLAKGLIYCLLITMFAMSLLGPNQQAAICQSRSGYYIATALDRGVGILPQEIHDVVGPYLASLDSKLKHGQEGSPNGGTNSGPAWPGIDGNLDEGFDQLPAIPERITDALQNIPIPGQTPNPNGGNLFPPNNSTQPAGTFPTGTFPPAGGLPGYPPLSSDPATLPPQNSPATNSLRPMRPTGGVGTAGRQPTSVLPR